MQACFGIAGAQAAGVREVFGSMTKAFHAGRAAQAGVVAALLASRGFTSAPAILEGRRGFGAVLSGQHDFARATDGLGARWEIHNNGLKPYACGVVCHPLIDACCELRMRGAVQADTVVAIEAQVHPLVLELVDRPEVAVGLEGKFSAQHCLAVALVDGAAGPAQFTDARAHDPAIAALRRRVHLTRDDRLQEDQARVRLALAGGTAVEHYVAHAVGSPSNPMADAHLEQKFRTLAAERCAGERREMLLQRLWNLEQQGGPPDLAFD
jgi:2-methylcitrate dehydratase PrpD